MPKIVVTRNLGFTDPQKERLSKLGETTFYEGLINVGEEWLERVKGADIIISGSLGLSKNLSSLKNVFISIPFVSLGQLNVEELKKNKVTIANSPGCNKYAVSEWIISMLLNLVRKLDYLENKILPKEVILKEVNGLKSSKVLILGKGNVGSRVGAVCDALGMKVDYYLKGDNLIDKVKPADIVINCLSSNVSTIGLLDESFFKSFKKGSYFITVSRQEIYDTEAMLKALDDGNLAGLADDCSSEKVGDTTNEYYKKLIGRKNVLATPHIAWNTKDANDMGNEMAIDNVEAWIKGEPINLMF